eukprot:gnl/Chilomastix_cuspidata/10848.p1 GENE.gnl/Chilomastix_cuspidata/10848~~gnl/Chilomastix_cuspidata/10848.p1  ORF type:complete len:107 (-),score=2.63 gnl/Chilomastix_cuspidata/10848:39-332(-)
MHKIEFKNILKEIQDQRWSLSEWAGHEADDWFQTDHFHGGFEADESYEDGEFNFSFYDNNGKEWWFTFRLEEVERLLKEGFDSLDLTDPDSFDANTL